MAEPYSDEELATWLDRLAATAEVGFGDARALGAIRRLQRERDEARRERDEARRMARELALMVNCSDYPQRGEERVIVRVALAYPEAPNG